MTNKTPPDGWKLIEVNEGFDPLMDALERAHRKGYMPDAITDSYEGYDFHPVGPDHAEKFDDVLVPFLSLMRKELHTNTGKGDRPGWLAMDANTALLEVYHHLAKLQKAVRTNDGPAIQEYSADVANMAMMVLDVCGGLAWFEVAAFPSPSNT